MKHLSYLPPLLTFVAVVAALLGPTSEDGQTGLGAVTLFGWVMIVIAALSLGVSLVLARQKEVEASSARLAAHQAATDAAAKTASLNAATARLLKPGLDHIRLVLDFIFVIGLLDDRTDPRSLPVDRRGEPTNRRLHGAAAARATPLDSEERTHILKTFNYLPRTGFDIGVATRMLLGRPDLLTPGDPHGTGVPFALDRRPFPQLIAEEFAAAADLLREAVEQPGYGAFHPEVLRLTNELLDHDVMKTATDFPARIDRFLSNEDISDAPTEDSPDDRAWLWEQFKVTFIVDNGISIGVELSSYEDFVQTFIAVSSQTEG